jgi:hypothetical protein
MSAELSRRLARVALLEPIRSLPPPDRRGMADAAEGAATFEELPQRFQQMIVTAEATCAQLTTTKHASGAAPT